MAKPAARITDPTSCPMPGHGPKAIASGSPDVFFDGLAAASKGDTCTCGSALVSGVSATVFIKKNRSVPFLLISECDARTRATNGDEEDRSLHLAVLVIFLAV